MTTPATNGANNGYSNPASPPLVPWNDNMVERDFNPGGGGNEWQDWGRINQIALAPPMGCPEDVLTRTPIEDPLDRIHVDGLWNLMIEQINAPCSRYNLELRMLRDEAEAIALILSRAPSDAEPEDRIPVRVQEFPAEFHEFIRRAPLTIGGCEARLGDIDARIQALYGLIDQAIRGGVYYDASKLFDWFNTPAANRSTSSPSLLLPKFGQILFGILGVSAQNTAWTHIESILSRQLAPKFGGNYDENEKTRYRQPGVYSNSVSSTAPGVS